MKEQVEKILIEYTSSDGTAHRFVRLRRAVRIFTQVAGLTDEQVELLINSVHDQKGELWIGWRLAPSEAQKRSIEAAWRLCEESVVHHDSYTF